jgi:hypothetical protein
MTCHIPLTENTGSRAFSVFEVAAWTVNFSAPVYALHLLVGVRTKRVHPPPHPEEFRGREQLWQFAFIYS